MPSISNKRETYTHRPMQVSDEVMEDNWSRIFGKHQPTPSPVLDGQVEAEAGSAVGEGAAVLDVQADGASGSGNSRGP